MSTRLFSMDLQMHTVFSDGRMQPEERIFEAQEKSLDVIAITDHNTSHGYLTAKEYIQRMGMTSPILLQGIEIEAIVTIDDQKTEVEILGYGFNPQSLDQFLLGFREVKARAILERITQMYREIGVKNYNARLPNEWHLREDINADDIFRLYVSFQLRYVVNLEDAIQQFQKLNADGKMLGKFILDVLSKSPANLKERREIKKQARLRHPYFFEKEIGEEAYVPDVARVIAEIHSAGGIAILSHPSRYDVSDYIALSERLLDLGLEGVDLNYNVDSTRSASDPKQAFKELHQHNERLKAFAKQHQIIFVYSSDSHRVGSILEVRKIPEYEPLWLEYIVSRNINV